MPRPKKKVNLFEDGQKEGFINLVSRCVSELDEETLYKFYRRTQEEYKEMNIEEVIKLSFKKFAVGDFNFNVKKTFS